MQYLQGLPDLFRDEPQRPQRDRRLLCPAGRPRRGRLRLDEVARAQRVAGGAQKEARRRPGEDQGEVMRSHLRILAVPLGAALRARRLRVQPGRERARSQEPGFHLQGPLHDQLGGAEGLPGPARGGPGAVHRGLLEEAGPDAGDPGERVPDGVLQPDRPVEPALFRRRLARLAPGPGPGVHHPRPPRQPHHLSARRHFLRPAHRDLVVRAVHDPLHRRVLERRLPPLAGERRADRGDQSGPKGMEPAEGEDGPGRARSITRPSSRASRSRSRSPTEGRPASRSSSRTGTSG